MKRRKERSKRMRVLHLWSWPEVAKAVAYLRSVTGSLREHYLEVLSAQNKLARAAHDKAPKQRNRLIETQAATEERQRAQDKFDDALEELNKVDVFLLDPVQGLALIPFRKEERRPLSLLPDVPESALASAEETAGMPNE